MEKMAEVNKFMEFIKKHGVNGVMVLWLLYMHSTNSSTQSRVSILEDKLYNCYVQLSNRQAKTTVLNPDYIFAVLPDKNQFKIKRL